MAWGTLQKKVRRSGELWGANYLGRDENGCNRSAVVAIITAGISASI
jgi:hypothetical protein